MYARDVGDQQVTLFVSGKLWARSLVMQDKETQSLWSHILGQAMAGPLKGKSLESIPALMTDWSTWRTTHPHTSIVMLDRTAASFNHDMYRRLEEFGLGLVVGAAARFWRLDLLQQQPLVNDELADQKLLVLYDDSSKSAQAFRRDVNDRTLNFRNDGDRLIDNETQSLWDRHSGKSVSGPLHTAQLQPVPAIMSFSHAWLLFHPDSTRWQPASTE